MARTPKGDEDRREQILDAAMHVFSRKGFARASNKDIAHEAGITTGLIYHYFENRAALLKSLLEERSPIQRVRNLYLEMGAQPPEVLLPVLVKRILSIVEDDKVQRLLRIFLPEALFNPLISGMGLAGVQEGTRYLATYLDAQIAGGVLRPCDTNLAAQTFMGEVMGFIVRRVIMRDPSALQYTHDQIADFLAETTLQGLRPR